MPDIDHGPVALDDLAGRNFAQVWEVASILECDPRTVRTACRLGEIPHTKAGTEYRIPVAWILRQAQMAGQVAGGDAA